MKKITLFVAAALSAISAFAFELPEEKVEIYALETEFVTGAEGAYKYQWVGLAADFADAEKTISSDYNALALVCKGDIFQFRFEIAKMEGDPAAETGKSPFAWLQGEHTDAGNFTLTSLNGEVPATSESDVTLVFLLPSSVTDMFASGDAGMHTHFGGMGSTKSLTITNAYLFHTTGTGIGAVAAEGVESAKPFIYNGMTVFPTKDGFVNILNQPVSVEE